MKKLMLLSVLILSTAVYSEPLDLAFEWVEEFELNDDLEIKEKKGQKIPSKDLSFGGDDYEFLTEIDFDLEEWEEGEINKKNKSEEEEILFVSIENPIDSDHTISEVDFDLEELTDEEPVESDIIFSSSGVSHKEPLQLEVEEIAIAELPEIPVVELGEVCTVEETMCSQETINSSHVTNQEYTKFVKSTGHRPPSHWVKGEAPVGEEDRPVVNVSYKDAYLYVIWAGGRLPTDSELREQIDFGEPDEDLSQVTGEWTSTPARVKQTSRQGNMGEHIGTRYVPSHLVFVSEKDDSLALQNTESNFNTGFRSMGGKQK